MKNILIIGGGNMGYAIADGMVKAKRFKKNQIFFIEQNLNRIKFLTSAGFNVFKTIQEVNFKRYKFQAFIIAVKPKDTFLLLKEIKPFIKNNILLISIVAGVTISSINSILRGSKTCRVMPNTPCQIGEGISVLTFSKEVSNIEKQIVKKIFLSIGEVLELSEEKLDVVTALSGSGPAYFCLFLEALSKGAVKLGLSSDIAYKLALETGFGTFKMLKSIKNLSPESLRTMVTSPNGTTFAAINSFINDGFYDISLNALKAAKRRSIELGKKC